jgi:hypothetical protein
MERKPNMTKEEEVEYWRQQVNFWEYVRMSLRDWDRRRSNI